MKHNLKFHQLYFLLPYLLMHIPVRLSSGDGTLRFGLLCVVDWKQAAALYPYSGKDGSGICEYKFFALLNLWKNFHYITKC